MQAYRQTDMCGEGSLASLGEIDRNLTSTVPMSLDLETMCLSYQLPRYLVPNSCDDPSVELPFSVEIDGDDLFKTREIASELISLGKDMHIESIFQSNSSYEKVFSDPKALHPTKKKSFNKKSRKVSGKHSAVDDHSKPKGDSETEMTGPELKNRISCSEPPTEDSASTVESVDFPGLAGSQAYFKKAACVACKQVKIVFWFGDTSIKKSGDKFTCAECIRNCIGEKRFISLFQIECQWAQETSYDMSLKKPWISLKQYIRQRQPQNIDPIEISLNYLIEEKKYSVQKTLAKMNKMLLSNKVKGDLETLLLCLRFVHDLIESLNRLADILTKPHMQQKLDCMDANEREYFLREAPRIESLVSTIKEETMKALEAEASREKEQQVSSVNPVRSLGFGLDFEETPILGKRDPAFRNHDSFPDIEEPDLDTPFKIAPFSTDFMMPHF